jgi:tetratricopeptide (TPR) repeat protein
MQWCHATARTFFRAASCVVVLVAAGCASGPDAGGEFAVHSQERAEQSRAHGLASLAARQYEEAARLYAEQGDLASQVDSLLDASECWLQEGMSAVAATDVERAERLVAGLAPSSSRRRAAELRVDTAKGDLDFVEGRLTEARRAYEETLRRAVGRERDPLEIRLSLLAEQTGDSRRAASIAATVTDRNDPRFAELRRVLHATPGAAAPTAAPKPPPAAKPESATVAGLTILPRSAWGARRTRPNLDRMTTIWRITVHHTATTLPSNSSRVAADAIRTFQKQHQDDKGWADIGYHYVVDPSGRIWEGRPIQWQGAHAGNPELNVGNVGVALIGDFTVQQPSAAQKKALCDLLDSLCARYHVERGHVYTHKEIRQEPTECPGPALQRVVDAWRRGGVALF